MQRWLWNFFAVSTVLSGNRWTIGQPGQLDTRINQTLSDNRDLQGASHVGDNVTTMTSAEQY
jgi:hypothetical protein